MVKIQIELDKKENKIVSIFKAQHDLQTKQQAIKKIIQKIDEE
jgi:hypothetical protein